jgi:hypothetical protein
MISKEGVIMQFVIAVLLCLSGAITAFSQDSSVIFKPLTISSGVEAGEVVNGYDEQYRVQLVQGGHWQARLGVWLSQEVNINKRLTFKMGVGGLFYNPYPEETKTPDDFTTKFGPGIAQATGIYSFGGDDPGKPWFQLQFGYFPYKYNNEASNLGEYLLRSGCYPGYIMGGNWNIIGDAVYRVLGARLSNYLFDKSLKMDLLISMERDVPPMYDLSPTFICDYTLPWGISASPYKGLIEIGAGVDWNHAISANENKTTPKDAANRYLPANATIIVNGVPQNAGGPNGRVLGSNDGIYRDPNTGDIVTDSFAGVEKYYSFRGVKLMGKACLDLKALFPSRLLGKEDLKFFGEVAVLGVENFPYYYDSITKRMPVMFGFNFPCFKFLDICSIQWEWYGSPWENSTYNPVWNQLPLPNNAPDNPTSYLNDSNLYRQTLSTSSASYIKNWSTLNDFFSTDNWKWSILLQKRFNKYFKLSLQMADDNLRLKLNSGRSNYIPTTRGNDNPFSFFLNQWYYMFRLDYGI